MGMEINSNHKKILIVEDDQFLREFYQELLQADGYLIDLAADGETAAEKLAEGGYDLVMLDIMLPKKDGLEILREIKTNPPKKLVGPVVVLTNLGQDAIIKQAFALGAAGYIVKSAMNPDQVLEEIHNYLSSPR